MFSNISDTWFHLFADISDMCWKMKAFRKNFGNQEFCFAFYRLAHGLLEAPTLEITQLVRESSLGSVCKTRTRAPSRSWFEQ